MSIEFPKSLKPNSTIGLICPAGGFVDYKPIRRVSKYLEQRGFKVKLGKSLISSENSYKYLSGTDNKRLEDLHSFFVSSEIDAIFCLRGGYGVQRLLNNIDFNLIKKNKKIVMGFSNITVLLLAIYSKTNLITFHGPLLGYSFLKNHLSKGEIVSTKKMWELLASPKFQFAYDGNSTVIYPGRVRGKLLGGNLTEICSMLGSNYLPSFKNSILFLEDVGEKPYTIDRLLTQLLNANIFSEVKGLIFSSFEKSRFKNKKEIVTLLSDRIKSLKKPAIFNFPIGHGSKNYAVPIGIEAELDTYKCLLQSI